MTIVATVGTYVVSLPKITYRRYDGFSGDWYQRLTEAVGPTVGVTFNALLVVGRALRRQEQAEETRAAWEKVSWAVPWEA